RDTRAHRRVAADIECDVELPRSRVEESARGDAAHAANRAAQPRVRQRVDGDFDSLTGRDVGPILLRELRGHLDVRGVDHFGNRLTGERRVADAIVRHRAAEIDAAERLEIRAHRDDAFKGRAHVEALDVALRHLDGQLRLVPFLAYAVAGCLSGRAMGV